MELSLKELLIEYLSLSSEVKDMAIEVYGKLSGEINYNLDITKMLRDYEHQDFTDNGIDELNRKQNLLPKLESTYFKVLKKIDSLSMKELELHYLTSTVYYHVEEIELNELIDIRIAKRIDFILSPKRHSIGKYLKRNFKRKKAIKKIHKLKNYTIVKSEIKISEKLNKSDELKLSFLECLAITFLVFEAKELDTSWLYNSNNDLALSFLIGMKDFKELNKRKRDLKKVLSKDLSEHQVIYHRKSLNKIYSLLLKCNNLDRKEKDSIKLRLNYFLSE